MTTLARRLGRRGAAGRRLGPAAGRHRSQARSGRAGRRRVACRRVPRHASAGSALVGRHAQPQRQYGRPPCHGETDARSTAARQAEGSRHRGRIPPGQYQTDEVPGPALRVRAEDGPRDLGLQGLGRGGQPVPLTWAEFKALPRKTVHTDIHCVTRWTKLDTDWEGVPIQDDPRARAGPAGRRRSCSPIPSRATRPTCRCRCSTTTTSCSPTRSTASRSSPSTATRCASRPEALLLEERQVDPRPGVPRPRHPGLLGALRLQQRRRSLEGRALLGVRSGGRTAASASAELVSHHGRRAGWPASAGSSSASAGSSAGRSSRIVTGDSSIGAMRPGEASPRGLFVAHIRVATRSPERNRRPGPLR